MKLSDSIQRTPLFVAFGQSLQTGGLTSVDLEAVRDETTVTLTASDGSVAPIDGADASTAGVMTAADKVTLDGLSSAATRHFAARSEVATASIDAGITHIRTAGHAAAGDGGGALYVRAGSEPAHALKVQSADGAWWELVADNGWINVLQAGADPTGVADSIQAFRDCADFARYNTGFQSANAANGPAIMVPQGKYHWSDTFEPRAAIRMFGFLSGVGGGDGTVIEVGANKTALILPNFDTIGAGREDPDDTSTYGANGSRIEGINFQSLGGTDNTKHGIFVRCFGVTLRYVRVDGFPGNGFHIVASVGAAQPDDVSGNASNWLLDQCHAHGNHRSGAYISGSDVNAGVSKACFFSGNGRWGLWDKSFLSNLHLGNHAADNGKGTSANNSTEGVTSAVTHNGNRYLVVPGNAAAASTTEPGTDSSVWWEFLTGGQSAGPAWPAWSSGNTYVEGGAWHLTGGVKEAVGCYAENDNPSVVEPFSRLMGGTNAYVLSRGSGGFYGSHWLGSIIKSGGLSIDRTQETSDALSISLMPALDPAAFMNMFFTGGPSSGVGHRFDGENISAFATTSGGSAAFEILTDLNTSRGMGRLPGNEPGQKNILFNHGIFLGRFGNDSRWLTFSGSAPTSGIHGHGDVVLNKSPTVQTDTDGVDWIIHGWQNMSQGDPGTWKTLWVRVSNPPGL